MSYILNEAESFAAESVAGLVAANRGIVRQVSGGVARAEATPPGQVAVVIGGGSGHYPAFAGLVGRGIAHAAALGNVFASPSAQQVVAVARAVASEAGVLLCYGNYTGDALNFDLAQDRLRSAGIPCETVRVTDDICSAPPTQRGQRRGIAGGLAVYRAAGWGAERGLSLSELAEFVGRANDRTRSVGVAFSGCTLPGAREPLFTVPAGQMAVGVGIHGEPGIESLPLPTADGIAQLLVDRLLAELPDGVELGAGVRAGVILNGLGAVKGEELFVLYRAVASRLGEAGVVIAAPEVGEYATSFEMAGVSLSLVWLDDELELAWRAPAHTAAFRRGNAGGVDGAGAVETPADYDAPPPVAEEPAPVVVAGSQESRAAAQAIAAILAAISAVIDREADELGRLDAVAGDGDHGIGMQRGARAAAEAAASAMELLAGAGATLELAGDAWADQAGGTSGALWGSGLRAAGAVLGDTEAPDARCVAAAVEAARAAVIAYGKAQRGDKTLVDALIPFAESLRFRVEGGSALAEAWSAAARDATLAAQATADLLPRAGRARPHAEKSLGTPDPGAVSLALAMTTAGEVLSVMNKEDAA